jgi:hypothetical protein
LSNIEVLYRLLFYFFWALKTFDDFGLAAAEVLEVLEQFLIDLHICESHAFKYVGLAFVSQQAVHFLSVAVGAELETPKQIVFFLGPQVLTEIRPIFT